MPLARHSVTPDECDEEGSSDEEFDGEESEDEEEGTVTVIATEYVDLCSTGLTTITTTYTATICGGCTEPTPPTDWVTVVTVCDVCAETPTPVTLTKPPPVSYHAEPTPEPPVEFHLEEPPTVEHPELEIPEPIHETPTFELPNEYPSEPAPIPGHEEPSPVDYPTEQYPPKGNPVEVYPSPGLPEYSPRLPLKPVPGYIYNSTATLGVAKPTPWVSRPTGSPTIPREHTPVPFTGAGSAVQLVSGTFLLSVVVGMMALL